MRKLIILFAFFSLILCVSGGKLSESEDRKRAEKCGRVGKDAISTSSGDYTPPWAVRIYLKTSKDKPEGYRSSATLISPRHVLAAGAEALKAVNTSSLWEWVDGKQLDVKKECKDDVIPFPKKLLKNYNILLSTCKDPDVCGTDIRRKVVSGWYIGNCDLSLGVFGFLLLEISSNVPKDTDNFRSVCMPADKKQAAVGSQGFFHSSGEPSLDSKMDGMIKWTTSQIRKCDDWRRLNSMTCATHNSCGGDYGGALVQKVDGKDTVIGISTVNDWDCKKKTENDMSVSMAYYKDKVCELAGVCQTAVTTSSAKLAMGFESFLLVFVMLVLVL